MVGISVKPMLEIILIEFPGFRARVIQIAQRTNCYREEDIGSSFVVF